MKKLFLITLSFVMLLPLVVNAAFSDVPSGHWAEGYINELTEKGVINGMSEDTFAPDGTLTKGQFMKLIMTASIPDMDFNMTDQNFNHWAAGYISTAEHYGILESGEMDQTNVDLPISRIEVVKILSLCDINLRKNDQKVVGVLEFNDVDELDPVAKVLLGHAVASGVINGYTDGSFKPNNNLTRAEASKIISVYMSL